MSSYMYRRVVLWFDKGVYKIKVFVKRHAYDVSTRKNVLYMSQIYDNYSVLKLRNSNDYVVIIFACAPIAFTLNSELV